MSAVAGAAVVVMGVSGCGKSTIAAALAERIGGAYVDADDLHSRAAVQKMSAGSPLTDDDRWPWLDRIGARIAREAREGRRAIVACSALRRRYRDAIRAAASVSVVFVHLQGTPEVIAGRLAERPDHFMPASLLASQFATLEPLDVAEPGFAVDLSLPVDVLVEAVSQRLLTSQGTIAAAS